MLFLGPLLGAFVWYYGFGANLAPRGQSNHAPLIQPAVPLQAFDNALLEGNVNLQSLERFWTVVHLLNRQCDAGCEKALYNTRQTRIAVGKDGNRIQRFIISANAALLKQLENEHSDAKLVMEKGEQGEGLEQQIRQVIRENKLKVDDAVLIDPLGNVMMAIPVELDPRLLLKDLKKLLKISRIG